MPFHLYKHLTKKQQISVVDHLMSVAAVAHPLSAIPQVYSIYTTHDVTGISLATWFGFMTLGMVFLAYGIAHKLKPFILTQILWFTIDILIVVGVLIYR